MRVSLAARISLAIGLFAILARGAADEPAAQSPRQQYEALVKAQREAQTEFSRAYQAATTKEEKDKVVKELGAKSQARNFSDDFLKLTQKYPTDPVAFDALQWLVSRDNAGSATRTALGNISDEIMQSDRMSELCELAAHGFIGREGDSLLNRLVKESPHRPVQAAARFAQAERLVRNFERASMAPGNARPAPPPDPAKAAIAEEYRAGTLRQIEEILRDVSDKYGDLKHYPGTYKDAAEGKLFEIKNLSIGCVAPEIVGEDLEGKPLKLSDFRGKVVLLDFWGTWCGPCMAEMPKYRQILARLEGQPFAVVGIDKDTDREAVKKVVAEKQITWPCFWDGPAAPITQRWNIHAWPTLYLIDAGGVIRYKGEVLRSRSVRKNAKGENEPYDLIDDRIDTLMKEMMKDEG